VPFADPNNSRRYPAGEEFLTTRWSRVVLAGDVDHPEAHAALSSLCQDYWRPLYHFARRKGLSNEDAQDVTQGFIMSLLEKGCFAAADQQRGRFRTFLISSFCHYLTDAYRAQSARKRGGGVAPLSLDEEPESGFSREAVETMTPELLYDRTWALAVLERVMTQLSAEYTEAGRTALFEAILPHLSKPSGRPGYSGLVESLGMSEGAVAVAVHRMRRRYGELLRKEIAATVASPEEVDDEIRHLMAVVSAAPGNIL
jgi:RNA polymerase sigma factor (sigma-70 family)